MIQTSFLNGLSTSSQHATAAAMQRLLAHLLFRVILSGLLAHKGRDCWARPYAAPGFESDRRLFSRDSLWDQPSKVAFHNVECTLLAANFRDTGSQAVFVLFPAATITKEVWPLPELAQRLALNHNLSSLAVDIAGRGESCGYEVGPGCA